MRIGFGRRAACRNAAAFAVTAAVAVITAGTAAVAVPAAASRDAASPLTLARLRFVTARVDAAPGGATATLTWTVKDASRQASAISGVVDIRLQGPKAGSYVGQAVAVPFSLSGSAPGLLSAGTPRESFYVYLFPVPRYAGAKTAHWVVTRFTVSDGDGHALGLSGRALSGFARTLTATEKVDSVPPSYQALALTRPGAFPPLPYLYVTPAASGAMQYSLTAIDRKSGFWKGSLTLRGPGGKTLTAGFAARPGQCGTANSVDDTSATCAVTATFPAGTAAGAWAVSAVTLWDNAGNEAVVKNLAAVPVTVTADSVLSASGFTATPDPVDNWVSDVDVQLSMTVAGAAGGTSAVYVDSDGGPCKQESTTPVAGQDGTISVELDVFPVTAQCTVTGIAIVDGAGDVALYGSEYGAPDPGLVITRVPDTTPPAATGASLTASTISASSDPADSVQIDVSDQVAPVNFVTVSVLDAGGNVVATSSGSVPETVSGTVQAAVPVGALPPGSYTVAFELDDAGGLETSYGYPASAAVPGEPLTLTVTS